MINHLDDQLRRLPYPAVSGIDWNDTIVMLTSDHGEYWRGRMIEELRERPEGFTDGKQLLPGVAYPPALPHAGSRL